MYDIASGKEAQAKETMEKNDDLHSKSRVLRSPDQGGNCQMYGMDHMTLSGKLLSNI